jgi:phosphoribosylaminoimidazole-succinocarboxamide synthase
VALGLMTYEELENVTEVALQANKLLGEYLHRVGIELVDMRLEFGRASDNGHIIISDEISPDTCRLWDEATGEKLDKDRFRLDLSDVVASYKIVLDRLNTIK